MTKLYCHYSISIHAPRTGSDICVLCMFNFKRYFNPRSPHGERRDLPFFIRSSQDFNPRSPHGERHGDSCSSATDWSFQSTLPARGATPGSCRIISAMRHFNPRSPHGERLVAVQLSSGRESFQSTLPARGATDAYVAATKHWQISIHAPRTGSDVQLQLAGLPVMDISIHAPRTGSDGFNRRDADSTKISIHAPRTGSDAAKSSGHSA